jgi:hypothetical protein
MPEKKTQVTYAQMQDRARELYAEDGQIEFDDDPTVSSPGEDGDNGGYVQAWVWVGLNDDEELVNPPEPVAVPGC